jgi:HAD superfamily hydrolase (TIGR01509 family)
LREIDRNVTEAQARKIQKLHAEAYKHYAKEIRLLPGSRDLLKYLSDAEVPWAIATSSKRETAQPVLKLLGVTQKDIVITRNEVKYAKPDPDLFLVAAKKLRIDITRTVVVGDSVWDILAAVRARALPVGLLSGGYGEEELERAGAYRVYLDPADLLNHLDEVGVRTLDH